jgi:hypothetical protein
MYARQYSTAVASLWFVAAVRHRRYRAHAAAIARLGIRLFLEMMVRACGCAQHAVHGRAPAHARAAYMHAAHSRCDRATADIAQSRARGPAPGQHARPAAAYDARHGRGGTNASAAGRRPHDAVQTSQHACTALQRIVLRCNVLYRVATCCTALQHVIPRCNVLYRVAPRCNTTRCDYGTRLAAVGLT